MNKYEKNRASIALMLTGDKPSVYIKRNKMQELIDYCLDSKIQFSVKERSMGIDEYEFTLDIENVKTAVLFGMFLRENKLELAGMAVEKPVVKKAAPVKKSPEPVNSFNSLLNNDVAEKTVTVQDNMDATEDTDNQESKTLSFDLN